MSLSQPKPQNPCKKFIEFKGDSGVFQYWDKDKKQNIKLPLPLSFIVLDELNTITGFNDSTQSGVYSNEVHSLKHQDLVVRTFKGGFSVTGKYDVIKDKIKNMGGKFCKSVYAAAINGDDLELVNLQLKGIAFSAWMDKTVDLSAFGVTVKGCTDGKKGAIKYKIPTYSMLSVPRPIMDKAVEMDKALQEYLKAYKTYNKVDESVQEHPKDDEHDAHEDGTEKMDAGSSEDIF